MENDYKTHLKEVELSWEEKAKNKGDDNTIVAVFDFQTILPRPNRQSPSFYYIPKLYDFNLTVLNLKINSINKLIAQFNVNLFKYKFYVCIGESIVIEWDHVEHIYFLCTLCACLI